MKVVADENMPGLEPLSELMTLVRKPGRHLGPEDLVGAQALLVRSVTRVDARLLAGSGVQFVGSATIGTDHVDQAWLARQGITFAHAPGCNARAVAEYVLQAALIWAEDTGRTITGLSIGVVGVGNVGRDVAVLFGALGCEVRLCDPPREAAGEQQEHPWSNLDNALRADIVSLHVPLEKAGQWPTLHLLDAGRLASMHSRQLLVNTCRGAVIDNQALLTRLQGASAPAVVLDVWEHEPAVPADLLHRVLRGTPHIAGYSIEGKLRGSAQVMSALWQWSGQRAGQPEPEVACRAGEFSGSVQSQRDLLTLLQVRYALDDDWRQLMKVVAAEDSSGFDALRRNYGVRHEMAGLRVRGSVSEAYRPLLTLLGVRV